MEKNFEELVSSFDISSLSNDILEQLTCILKQQIDELLPSFVSQVYQSLVILENNIWQLLNVKSLEWFKQLNNLEFFQIFALFNKKLIFDQENMKDDMKISLFIPEKTDQIDHIFQQIEQINDDNHPFIIITSLWFDNLAVFIHEHSQLGHLSNIIHISQFISTHFILTNLFKTYLIQLQHTSLTFTAKQLFYLKTCTGFLYTYFFTDPQTCEFTPDQLLSHIGNEYLQMIEIQSYKIESWNKDLLACISHIIAFMRAFLWWEGEKGTKLRMLLSTEKILCDHIQAHIRILDYKPFYTSLMKQRSNDETILIDAILLTLMNILQTQNIHWFFRSINKLPDTLLQLAQLDAYYRIHLCCYGILSSILTDECIKELPIYENAKVFFFQMLESAWRDPSKKFQQIPIDYLLKGNSNSLHIHINHLIRKKYIVF